MAQDYADSNVGQGKASQEPVEAYDKAAGTYKDLEVTGPEKLQESQMPKAPDPSPFKLGPMAPGGR